MVRLDDDVVKMVDDVARVRVDDDEHGVCARDHNGLRGVDATTPVLWIMNLFGQYSPELIKRFFFLTHSASRHFYSADKLVI